MTLASQSKSVDFLLDNAGDVIKYRLRKEILRDLGKDEEERLLQRVMETPHYRLLKTYQKPNGYIGIGMHSWEKFKETPLQDGEYAARLISNYAIPKDTPLVAGFARALRDEDVLEREFSYYGPEAKRFKNRRRGLRSGSSLQLLIDTCLALMGFGDDGSMDGTIKTSHDAFKSMLSVDDMLGVATFNPGAKRKYNYPYIGEDTLFPCAYHLQVLAHTASWRNERSVGALADVINHLNDIMREGFELNVKIGSDYYVPLWALRYPIKPYECDRADPFYRRMLTDIAKTGVGHRVDVIQKSVENIEEALREDGILRIRFAGAYQKRRYKAYNLYPGPYNEVALEVDYASDIALWCDLTFWAVQFLHLCGETANSAG